MEASSHLCLGKKLALMVPLVYGEPRRLSGSQERRNWADLQQLSTKLPLCAIAPRLLRYGLGVSQRGTIGVYPKISGPSGGSQAIEPDEPFLLYPETEPYPTTLPALRFDQALRNRGLRTRSRPFSSANSLSQRSHVL